MTLTWRDYAFWLVAGSLCVALVATRASATPHSQTPHDCAWWLDRLGEIARLETMRVEDVPRIAREENVYAATDFDIDLAERIRRIQKAMEKECRK